MTWTAKPARTKRTKIINMGAPDRERSRPVPEERRFQGRIRPIGGAAEVVDFRTWSGATRL
jgi:hypothetical protein